jgi:hypothetical protein
VPSVPPGVLNHNHNVVTVLSCRPLLYGLKYGQVESVNSLHSIFSFCERPWVHAELVKISRRLGKEAFPLIPQAYYPDHRSMMFTAEFPVVSCSTSEGLARKGRSRLSVV